jgi:GWxTD domain-containing protein
MRSLFKYVVSVVCGCLLVGGIGFSEQPETVAKPISGKEKKKREARLRKELETPFRKWVREDVAYIISGEERAAFARLATDEERQSFIESFWLKRDPTPDTAENEFKEEHYRRIAYANERYASGIPGWKSDRGRIYIMYGPPSENDSHPSGGSYERPIEEGGGTTSTYPFEKWRYRYIEGIGANIEIEFVDTTMTGEYRMTMDPSEKDALLNVPGAGLSRIEEMGLSSKIDRFNRPDGTHLATGNQPLPESMNVFSRLKQFVDLQGPPATRFPGLEAMMVKSTIKYNMLPMKAHADFMRITNSTVLSNITLQFDRKDLQFQDKQSVSKAVVNIYGRITSMTGRRVQVFEDPVTIEIPTEMLGESIKGSSIYQKSIPLPPGRYRLNVVAKDIIGNAVNNHEMVLDVPHYDDEKLAASSIILADTLERVPARSIGSGQFVIGTTKVRPRLDDTFRRDENLGVYVQFYNFTPDAKTEKPNGTIHYQVIKTSSTQKVYEFSEEVAKVENASATQVVFEQLLPLKGFEPGQYTLKMTVTDRNGNQTLSPSANFTVN